MAKLIDIDSRELVRFTNKLEKLHRSDLPIAIRSTMDNLAFRMKGVGKTRGQIDIEAERSFDNRRNKKLFKAMTGVQKAKGFNIESMESKAGIISRSGRDQLAQGLADQQEGGNVKSAATPLDDSRINRQTRKKVRTSNYIQDLNPINITRNKGKRFHQRIQQAIKNDRAITFKSRDGSIYVAEVNRLNRGQAKYRYSMKVFFRINPSKFVALKKKRPFVNNAARQVMKDLPREFEKEANKRIKRAFEK